MANDTSPATAQQSYTVAGSVPICGTLPPSIDQAVVYPRMVANLREHGGYVSSKIQRGVVPPLNVPGILATERLEPLEQIVRIPMHLQITQELVRELDPELISVVKSISSSKIRIENPEVVVVIAKRLSDLAARGWCGVDVDQNVCNGSSWLDLCFGCLLGCEFDCMPHSQLTADKQKREVMRPSPEVHNADWNHSAFVTAHAAIAAASQKFGSSVELCRFVQAYFILLTRTFGNKGCHRVVPVADMINHSCVPNASWTITEDGDMLIKMIESAEPGQEIFISYGPEKSNVRLYRTYGFTLPPSRATSCSIRIWPSEAGDVYEKYLTKATNRRTIELETHRVYDSTEDAIKDCASRGLNPVDFLRDLCMHYLAKYDADDGISATVQRLKRRWKTDPSSSDWWTPFEDEALDQEGPDNSQKFEDDFPQTAVRVKMSEYLCLTVHAQIIEIFMGIAKPCECMEIAVNFESDVSKVLQADGAVEPAKPP